MIDKGADVMYAERFGVSDAAKERGEARDRQRDRHAGQVSRTRSSPRALWNMEPTIDTALKAVKDGKFKAEDYGPLSNLAAGGCSWRRSTPSWCRTAVVDKVQAKEAAIRSGELKVVVDDTEPKSTK